VRLEGEHVAKSFRAVRRSGRGPVRFVGRIATTWIFLVVGALLLAGLVSPQRVALANTSASVLESFGAANTGSGNSSLAASPTAATGAGDLLVAVIRTRNITTLAPVSTVTDSASDTWAPATSKSQGSGDEEIWYAANAQSLSTSQSVTVTVSGTAAASTAIAFTVLDVIGAAPSSPLDVAASNAASSGTAASTGTTATTTQASEIAVSDIAWNTSSITTSGQTTGYTVLATQTSKVTSNATGEQGAWLLLSTTGAQSYSATLSATAAWAGAIATFKTGTPAPPTITSFSPGTGPVGTPVTITGTNFTGATAVTFFNGVAASYTVTDSQHISTTVPVGAATGVIKVTAGGVTATSSTNFTVSASPTPTITSFSPTSGPPTTPVGIVGTGFTGATLVQFNGTNATFTVTNDQNISTSVPTGATTGKIKVTTPGGSVSTTTNFTVTAASHPPHIMLIVDENKDYSQGKTGSKSPDGYILNNTQAPYLNQLMTQYASATNWYSLAHPSYKNYLGLLSGQTLGGIPHSSTTLADQLNGAGIPWAGYMEGLKQPPDPSSCDPNAADQENSKYDDISPDFYEWDHNPFWYFTNITSNPSECDSVVPYPGSTSLLSTLNSSNPPDFIEISPNGCDDGHDNNLNSGTLGEQCQYPETKNADLWFQGPTNLEGVTPTLGCPANCLNLPAILTSSWYQSGGIIIITWDEAPSTDTSGGGLPNTNGGQIATIVISADSHGPYSTAGNDYGILRAIDEQYGFTPLANAANAANGDLRGAFTNGGTVGSISGTVNDSITSAPISGASVTCTGTPTCTGTTTAANGTYTLNNLTPGTYTVQVSAANYGTLSSPDTVTSGAAPPDNFNLVPNTGSISGTVTDSVTNADLSGASVTCTGTPTCTGTSTSGTGAYTLSGLTEGTYQVTVTEANYTSQTLPVSVGPGGTPTRNFALVPNQGSIGGTVTNSVTTLPISGASITCTGTPTCSGTTTAANGTYALSSLTEGIYQVTASAPGYATSTTPVSVTAGATVTGANFALIPATGSITGRVTDKVTSANIAGASVTCTGTPTCSGTTTATDGTYTLSNLAAGTYTVQVVASGYGTQSASVPVTAGLATQNFNLVPNPGSITGTVTDSVTGVPISGASVTCTGTLTCTPTATGSDGTYTLSNLTEGTYQVTFAANEYGSQSPNVNVGPGGTATESPVLVPNSGSISGTVSDSVSGNPIPGASVSCTGTPACTGMTTGSDGSYLLSPLNEGNYSVTVSATGYKSQTTIVVVGPGGNPTQGFSLVVNTAPLGVAQSFGSFNSGSTGGTTLTATTTTQTGSGDLLVLTIKSRSTPAVTVTGITDNALPANTWTKATGVVSGQADEEIWYAPNAGSVTSVTVTVSGTTSMAMTIADVTGASATTPRDQFATISGSVVPPQPSTGVTAATTQSNEIVIGDIGWNNTATLSGLTFNPQTTINLLPTQSSSVTSLKTSEQMAWQVVSTTHTQTLAGTLSGSFVWTGAIATFH
jgi:hypothetical protein